MIRRGGIQDLDLVFSIQREASVAGFAHIFPPERYRHPGEDVRRGLYQQLRDGENVLLIDGEGRGFALVGPGWLQRLFVRKRAWGPAWPEISMLHRWGRFGHEARGRPRLGALLKTPAHAASTKSTAGGLMAASGLCPYPPHPLDLGYSLEL